MEPFLFFYQPGDQTRLLPHDDTDGRTAATSFSNASASLYSCAPSNTQSLFAFPDASKQTSSDQQNHSPVSHRQLNSSSRSASPLVSVTSPTDSIEQVAYDRQYSLKWYLIRKIKSFLRHCKDAFSIDR